MKKSLKSPVACRGFTLVELLMLAAILGILFAVALPAYKRYEDRKIIQNTNLCEISESAFTDFAGGLAAGTALTGTVAGETISFVAINHSAGLVAIGITPAVAPVITMTAVTSAVAYATVKAWCNRHDVTNGYLAIHEIAVDNMSDTFLQIDRALLD